MSVPYRDEGSGTVSNITGIASHQVASYYVDLSVTKAGTLRADVNGINTASGESMNVVMFVGYKVFGGALSVTSSAYTVNFSDYPGISVSASVAGSALNISVVMTIAGQTLNDVDANLYVSATAP